MRTDIRKIMVNTKEKQTYDSPCTKTMEINVQNIICQSVRTDEIYSTETNVGDDNW